jgi:hypothetical protein
LARAILICFGRTATHKNNTRFIGSFILCNRNKQDETKRAVDSFILDFKTQKAIQKTSHGNRIFDLFFLPDSKRIVTSAAGITSLDRYVLSGIKRFFRFH